MVKKFLNNLFSEAYDVAHDPELGGMRLTALLRAILNSLDEANMVADGHVAYFVQETPNLASEVHGYAYDAEVDLLQLFYCIDANEDDILGTEIELKSVPKTSLDRGFRRLQSFVRLACSNNEELPVDESQPAYELIELVRECRKLNKAIEFCVVTTGVISERAAAAGLSKEAGKEVWDITALSRVANNAEEDKLYIDFEVEHKKMLPCLITDRAEDGTQVLLACIPGSVLANIYNNYRARLLERNVRSFLQFTGKVNKGIRATLMNSPERFLPYNNGISATASSVELEDVRDGTAKIKAVHDFQIVNGGQTTASIALTSRRGEADLGKVSVAMKLTIVPSERVDEVVPLISKYANTQNRVQEADFSSNHPWHVEFQQLSRNIWTRPTAETPRGSRWFYERARGQYNDELAANKTVAGKRRFKTENPTRQKITKTDLAKFYLSWDQRPQIVSRGAQKCFLELMNQISKERWKSPATELFRRIVAQAILFRATERLYGDLGFQGYRAQVVTFSVARLSYALQKRLPWEEIWLDQKLPKYFVDMIKITIIGVRDIITSPPARWKNVTEWSKRNECWSAVMECQLDLDIPEPKTLYQIGVQTVHEDLLTDDEQLLIEFTNSLPFELWMSIAKWAKETDTLQRWQRSIAHSIGSRIRKGDKPSLKQARQGIKILCESERVGFLHSDLTPEKVKEAKRLEKLCD